MTQAAKRAAGQLVVLPVNKDPVLFCQDLLLKDSRNDREIAEDIGVSPSCIWYWRNTPPWHGRISTVKKILKHYGWEIHYKRLRSK